jgi:hypothetical protein
LYLFQFDDDRNQMDFVYITGIKGKNNPGPVPPLPFLKVCLK